MNNIAKLEAINHFFRVHRWSSDCCHEPTETCRQTAIRAHSIPNGTILSALAEDGHVIMPHMKLKNPPPNEIEFKRVGRNNATTFTGLCSTHDNAIFRPIDRFPPDSSDRTHLFLLAYRAVLREYHVCLQNGLRFQSNYQKRVELGLSLTANPCDFGMLATSHLANVFECYEYKRKFDHAYLSSNWSWLTHHVIVFQNQPASVAVNSMISLDEIDAPETPRVTLNVYPNDRDVVVVFSATATDAPFVVSYLNRILMADGFYQKYLLSKLILQFCENFIIAPKYYDSLTQERKDAIQDFFIDSVQQNAENREDYRLYLF